MERVEHGVQEMRLADPRRPVEEERRAERRAPQQGGGLVGPRVALAHHEGVEGLLGVRRSRRDGQDGGWLGDAELDDAGTTGRGGEGLLYRGEEVAGYPVARRAIGRE